MKYQRVCRASVSNPSLKIVPCFVLLISYPKQITANVLNYAIIASFYAIFTDYLPITIWPTAVSQSWGQGCTISCHLVAWTTFCTVAPSRLLSAPLLQQLSSLKYTSVQHAGSRKSQITVCFTDLSTFVLRHHVNASGTCRWEVASEVLESLWSLESEPCQLHFRLLGACADVVMWTLTAFGCCLL